MRSRFLVFAAVISLATACSDAPSGLDATSNPATRQVAPPSGTLDQSIYGLLQLFPNGISTAGLNRWNNVKKAVASGKMDQAKSQLLQLSQWITDMAPRMADPPGDETRLAAAARLTLYMATYVYDGPSTAVPPYGGGADNAVGIITPGAGGTVVTPTTRAGVSVPVGAVDENTIVVITENLTPYTAVCSGPLSTTLCQYPRFYHFSQFPHKRLNVGAKFAVCHVNAGSSHTPLEDHDGFRLAHTLPANSADYTPGATQREGIEILPLITQTFSICDDVEYALNEPQGLDRVLAVATTSIRNFLTPKSAWAIDQGGGGMSFAFSDFNNVDPNGVPDDSVRVQGAGTNLAGDSVFVSYTVKNVGTATSLVVPADVYIVPTAVSYVPVPQYLTTANVMSLAPGDTINLVTRVPVSPTITGGSWSISVTLGSATAFPDANLGNNAGAASFTVGPIILRSGKRMPAGK